MPLHDIIGNRNEKLLNHINRILAPREVARFAVGYFSPSGLTPISNKLANMRKEL